MRSRHREREPDARLEWPVEDPVGEVEEVEQAAGPTRPCVRGRLPRQRSGRGFRARDEGRAGLQAAGSTGVGSEGVGRKGGRSGRERGGLGIRPGTLRA
jgi:hypothetical protein